MPKLIDYPDEPKFTIKAVSAQTGIRPVTLRAWERRHEVLIPHRSENRYRLYSDRDVAILRWLKNRVDNGVAISAAVVELRTITHLDVWAEAPLNPPIRNSNAPTLPASQYSMRLTQSLTHHDEAASAEILNEAITVYDLMTVCTQIIIPALVEIGEAWYSGRLSIAIEHFASSFLRGKLLTLLQSYPTRRGTPLLVIGCAPTEFHELGSLMFSVLLRSNGYRVEYLGADVPIEDLVDYADFEHPIMLILSATTTPAALELKSMQAKLNKLRNAPIFAYAGRAFVMNKQLINQVSGCYLGDTLEQAAQTVQSLLNRAKP
jgi:MerR family transcriptional regulator, light-induced transcriptional regulator